jgi:hypothetical protein
LRITRITRALRHFRGASEAKEPTRPVTRFDVRAFPDTLAAEQGSELSFVTRHLSLVPIAFRRALPRMTNDK